MSETNSVRCHPTFCNIFFQKKEFMNIENFYALKKLEWQANREHESAIKIQSFFRGWLIRKNLNLLNEAATKIQSLIRGFLARHRVVKLREELERQRQERLKNEAATIIQKYWRGYYSRKNCFDYYKYKHIQAKNAEFTRGVNALNELESLATLSTTSVRSTDDLDTLLNKLLMHGDDLSALLKLSPSRICALQEYIDQVNEELIRKGGKPARKNVKLAEKLKDECKKSCYKKDSLDQLFPEFPEMDGIVRPDKEKAAKLKVAMRKLRDAIEAGHSNKLAKQHYLLRTYQQPGVLSDICSHALTPAEKKLKALKFWKGKTTPQERKKAKEEEAEYWKSYEKLRHMSRVIRQVSKDDVAQEQGQRQEQGPEEKQDEQDEEKDTNENQEYFEEE